MLSNSEPEQRDYRLSTSGNRQNGSAKTFIGDFFFQYKDVFVMNTEYINILSF